MATRLTKDEKWILREALLAVNNCLERQEGQDIDSDYAYHGNHMNFILGMTKEDFETFKKAFGKFY